MPIVPRTTCHPGTLGLPCFGLDPTPVTCPYCRTRVTTKVLPRYQPMDDCEACCFAFFCCWCCENYDIKHVCPNCNKVLGTYHFLEGAVYYAGGQIYYIGTGPAFIV